jgi:hypothetical protein
VATESDKDLPPENPLAVRSSIAMSAYRDRESVSQPNPRQSLVKRAMRRSDAFSARPRACLTKSFR